MVKNTKFIYINSASLCHEICEDIIGLFEEEDNKYEGVTASGLNKDIKDTLDFIINKEEKRWSDIYSFLLNELIRNVKNYIHMVNESQNFGHFKLLDYESIDICNFMIQKYHANIGKYVYHDDSVFDLKAKRYRILTFLWYLNDVDNGGETEFYDSFTIKPQTGKLVIFPATWTFPHTGKIPISNNKYILTGWVYTDIRS